MPELPEIHLFAKDMHQELVGKTFDAVEIVQPKSLNLPPEDFRGRLIGTSIQAVSYHGKWIQLELSKGWLLINLGMGGEILLITDENYPEKVRLAFRFTDGSSLAVNFWWFGYAHWADTLADHAMTAKLGPNAIDLSLEAFRSLLQGRRGAIKPFLLNQARIAGIGNVTVQDPLFRARIHPMRKISDLSDDEVEALYGEIQHTLREAIEHGGSKWERNLYGRHGSWGKDFFSVAYRLDEPCPVCGKTIEKIKTGSTSSYICAHCQL
ncbi:MAG TPA: Fpg/Nei family DNA glycosylase [Anaerolineae bacterium]|nr:Fpg/Nei family DNA glycosylase [Anaerolineae bacterium]